MKASYDIYFSIQKEWVVTFYCGNDIDYEEWGTFGTGCKIFPTKEQAIKSGKRYLKKMQKNGFEI